MSVIRTLTRVRPDQGRQDPPRGGRMHIAIRVNHMSSLYLPRHMVEAYRWSTRANQWMTDGEPNFRPSLPPWLHLSTRRGQTITTCISIMWDDPSLSTAPVDRIRRDSPKGLRPPPNCQAVPSLPRERLRPVVNRSERRPARRITEEARISRYS